MIHVLAHITTQPGQRATVLLAFKADGLKGTPCTVIHWPT